MNSDNTHKAHSSSQWQEDTWVLSQNMQQVDNLRLAETLYSQGNGFIGVRGTPEEGWEQEGISCEGVYLNGVFSRELIPYGETAYAMAKYNDKLLQVPNVKNITIGLEPQFKVTKHERHLDMRTGVLSRQKFLKSHDGHQCLLAFERFVSADNANLICLKTDICSFEQEMEITLRAGCDDAYGAVTDPNDPRAGELSIKDTLSLSTAEQDDDFARFIHTVSGTSTKVATTCIDLLFFAGKASPQTMYAGVPKTLKIPPNSKVTFVRYALFHHHSNETALKQLSQSSVNQLLDESYEVLKARHLAQMSDFWQQANLQLEMDTPAQSQSMLQGLRFSMFHLFQSAGRNGTSAIAAKGLTGPGYDGHYFWDTEIYIVPFFALTQPHIARQLLMYRYHTLPHARTRAREMAHSKGALFAWRTIGGDECSAYFPAGTAQYHINSAIAYAIRTYYRATGDWTFMAEYGAELLFESARLWAQLGHFDERKNGLFCIDGVTGPDEYTAIVNNNFYTNYMAQQHLLFAVEVADAMADKSPQQFKQLTNTIKLDNAELALWRRIAQQMYLPFDETTGVHPQDDTFLSKARWDFEGQPEHKKPLLLHYHPLVIYRYQVLKQADVILAMLLGDNDFSPEQKRSNLAYYEPLTTHDSTLSSCIHSMVYAEIGEMEQAQSFFGDTARMDLDNLHNNTEYGAHMACMAGAWNCVVFGFLGLRIRQDGVHFHPRLPAGWQSIAQSLQVGESRIRVAIQALPDTNATQQTIRFELETGEQAQVFCFGERIVIEAGKTAMVTLSSGQVAVESSIKGETYE